METQALLFIPLVVMIFCYLNAQVSKILLADFAARYGTHNVIYFYGSQTGVLLGIDFAARYAIPLLVGMAVVKGFELD